MASLLSNDERVAFTSSINDHFDTFKRTITIYIEPKYNYAAAAAQSFLPGYRPSNTALPSYTSQSADHDAIVTYGDFNDITSTSSGKTVGSGKVKIKVKQTTKDYIANNKIQKIVINGDSFNIASEGRRANFLNKSLGDTYGEIFYIFELEYTK